VNRLTRRWRAVLVVDFILKLLVAYGGVVLVSLGMIVVEGMKPVIYFAILAAALATLNVMFLMLGSKITTLSRSQIIMRHPALQVAAVVICATAMFDAILTAMFSLRGDFAWAVDISLFISETNLVSISIVLLFDWILRVVRPTTGR
jgi:hypothetical protein